MTKPVRLKWLLDESDHRAGERAATLPLLSVSITRGVQRRNPSGTATRAAAEDLSNYKIGCAGDLVINRMRAFQGALGIAPEDGVVSPDYSVLRVSPLIERRWLNYYLTSTSTVSEMASLVRGIGGTEAGNVRTPRLNVSDLHSMRVSLDPLEQQRAIADYLDCETARIDTLIEEQQRLIEMMGERRRAVIDAALQPGDGWIRTTLKFLLDGIDQGVSPQAEVGLADEPGSWGVLKSGCVNRGIFRQIEHKRLEATFPVDKQMAIATGDLIVSRASGSPDLVGSAAVVDHLDYNLILSDKLFRLRLRATISPRFVYWFLNSMHYRVQVRRAISGAEGLANNLPLSALRATAVVVPDFDEQCRIVAYLDVQTAKIDALVAETERFIELSRERRAALITAAVTGQIDMRTEVA